jgi:hypothetical protein
LLMGWIAALIPIHVASAGENLLLGAIRWDAWFDGSPWAKELSRKEWNYRLPFFASVDQHGKAAIDGLSFDVMNEETVYASAAGIGYFIFGLYADRERDGSENKVMVNFRRSIDLFESLRDKHGMQFSVYLSIDAYVMSNRIRELLANYVTASSFLRTSDGRPVIFLFLPTARNWVRDLGGVDIATLRRHKLQTDIAKVTGKRPYLVVMTFNPTDGARLVSSVGFDAFTSYGNPLGSRRSEASTGEEPFARCATLSKNFWALAEQTGKPFLLPVSMGWDYRPILDNPQREKDPAWCQPPTAQEIKTVIGAAAKAAPRQPAIRSIVIYAWNEYSEGGWLAPTFCDGATRLGGIAAALDRENELSIALRDAPLPRATVNCSIPPGILP